MLRDLLDKNLLNFDLIILYDNILKYIYYQAENLIMIYASFPLHIKKKYHLKKKYIDHMTIFYFTSIPHKFFSNLYSNFKPLLMFLFQLRNILIIYEFNAKTEKN